MAGTASSGSELEAGRLQSRPPLGSCEGPLHARQPLRHVLHCAIARALPSSLMFSCIYLAINRTGTPFGFSLGNVAYAWTLTLVQ